MFRKKFVSTLWAAALLAALSIAGATSSFAQRPYEGPPFSGEHVGAMNGAVGASYGNAIISLQNEVLDATVFGMGAAQPGSGGVESGVFPTGRLRQTYHDGYRIVGGNASHAFDSPAFSVSEGSAFGTMFLKMPPSVLGGQLQLGAFAGYDSLFMRLSPSPFYYHQYGAKANNESFLYGGYGLYTSGASYMMLTLSGAEGQTDLSTEIPFSQPASYDTHGFIGSLTGGHVIDLSPQGARTPLKLDVRGGVSYVNMDGDTFVSPNNAYITYTPQMENWNGSLSATFFSQIPSTSGGMWRPFLKGEFRHQLYYDNSVDQVVNYGLPHAYDYKFDQADSTGALEVGLDYVLKGMTLNAAAYGEMASDRETYGGRVGAKFKFP